MRVVVDVDVDVTVAKAVKGKRAAPRTVDKCIVTVDMLLVCGRIVVVVVTREANEMSWYEELRRKNL